MEMKAYTVSVYNRFGKFNYVMIVEDINDIEEIVNNHLGFESDTRPFRYTYNEIDSNSIVFTGSITDSGWGYKDYCTALKHKEITFYRQKMLSSNEFCSKE